MKLTLSIYGRDYQVACDDGQEGHLRLLASHIDERMHQLAYKMGHTGESTLFLLTSLMLADELHDARNELKTLKSEIVNTSQSFEQGKANDMEKVVASTIEQIAIHIEKIAEQVEKEYTP